MLRWCGSRVLERVCCLTSEYSHFDTAVQFLNSLSSWDFLAACAATRQVLLISLEPPPSRFVKVNFDGNVKYGRGGVGFVIRSSDSKLLAATGYALIESSVPGAEFYAAWQASPMLITSCRRWGFLSKVTRLLSSIGFDPSWGIRWYILFFMTSGLFLVVSLHRSFSMSIERRTVLRIRWHPSSRTILDDELSVRVINVLDLCAIFYILIIIWR